MESWQWRIKNKNWHNQRSLSKLHTCFDFRWRQGMMLRFKPKLCDQSTSYSSSIHSYCIQGGRVVSGYGIPPSSFYWNSLWTAPQQICLLFAFWVQWNCSSYNFTPKKAITESWAVRVNADRCCYVRMKKK